jgi:bacterioferritin-associated ferredoxin
MYVCLCHGITDREIRRRSTEASCSVSTIYQARGVTPKCGKCVSLVRTILREAECRMIDARDALTGCGDEAGVVVVAG